MPIAPAPIVVDPSGEFLGDDGAWSTFLMSAGSPPQQVQVLASTDISASWAVAPAGCGPSDAANCTQARGGTYDDTKSTTSHINGPFQLGAGLNVGYTGNDINGTYGYDTLGLPGQPGGTTVSVDHQVIAGITTKTFLLGNLGLSSQPINFTTNDDSSPSFITSLKNENLIPSLSYGYTAGASYKGNGVNASLTLGGYDASRFTPNDVSFGFAPTLNRQLVVAIQSITYSDSKIQIPPPPLLSPGTLALVDSTVPYLWLPEQACQAFVNAFGISWDPIHNLYLVNDTLHDTLVKQNPSIVFQLSNSLTEGPSVNITLPYASFDLEATYPLVKNNSRYFPLQRANDDDAVTLGRTFLQEAFLIVDYEKSNFSISQSTFNANTPSNIVAISSTNSTITGTDTGTGTGTGTTSNPASTNLPVVKTTGNSSHSLGTGAIAGIAIAFVLIAMLGGSYVVYRILRKRQEKKRLAKRAEPKSDKPFGDDSLDMVKPVILEGPEVKNPMATTVTIDEVALTPPLSEADGEFFAPFGEKQPLNELPAESPDRSELPSPDELRSELSTPDPMYSNPELASQELRHELPSPSLSSGHPSPNLGHSRSTLTSPAPHQTFCRPISERIDSSEPEAGFTRDGMLRRPSFHQRYNSEDSDVPSLQSRPRHSRLDSIDSTDSDFIRNNRLEESSESDPAQILARPQTNHIDFSESDSSISSPSASVDSRRPSAQRMDSGSESEASISQPSASPSSRRGGSHSTFHSSSSSRPAIARRSFRHAITRPQTVRLNSSDSEGQQTSLDTSSAGGSMNVSSFSFLRHQRGDSNGVNETRDGLLNEEDEAVREGENK